MKRFHVHVAVADLPESIRFYSSMFGAAPSVSKPDYAKWMLDDPRVNFAISNRNRTPGLDHLGMQTESSDELAQLKEQLEQSGIAGADQSGAACCYARSDKYWIKDPQGIAWETFHTLDNIPLFGSDERFACCAPKVEIAAVESA